MATCNVLARSCIFASLFLVHVTTAQVVAEPGTIYKVVYRTRTHSKLVPRETHACCPGWSREPGKSGCPKPVCEKQCQHNGRCTGPNTCQCVRGWTGQDCSKDTNECSISNGDCQHYCENTPGSFSCRCRQGYLLAEDGRSCEVCVKCTAEWKQMEAKVEKLEDELQKFRAQVATDLHRFKEIDGVSDLTGPPGMKGSKGEKGVKGPVGPPVEALDFVIGRLTLLETKLNKCECSSRLSTNHLFPPEESSGHASEEVIL